MVLRWTGLIAMSLSVQTWAAGVENRAFSMVSCTKYNDGGVEGISISVNKVKDLNPSTKVTQGHFDLRGKMETSRGTSHVPSSSPRFASLKKTCDQLEAWNQKGKPKISKLVSCSAYKTNDGRDGISTDIYSVSGISEKPSKAGDSSISGRLSVAAHGSGVTSTSSEFGSSIDVCDLTQALDPKTIDHLKAAQQSAPSAASPPGIVAPAGSSAPIDVKPVAPQPAAPQQHAVDDDSTAT